MFGLLRAAFTLLICVLVIGFFLGWFTFTRAPVDPQSNKVNINVSVNRSKMGSDLQHLQQKMSKGIQDLNPPPGGNPSAPQGTGHPLAGPPRFSLGPMLARRRASPVHSRMGSNLAFRACRWGRSRCNRPPARTAGPVAPLSSPPQFPLATPDYQYTPAAAPLPGEGR